MIRSKLVNKINSYGDIEIELDEAMESLLNGDSISGIRLNDESETDIYNNIVKMLDRTEYPYIKPCKEYKSSCDKHLKRLSQFWFVPPEYMNIDIIDYLSSRCKSEEEIIRMAQELEEFNQRNQLDILKVMIYIVDQFRKNDVVWGIGRGSSVSCFCLYLIGINKINPMKYDIPYTEFFKDEDDVLH